MSSPVSASDLVDTIVAAASASGFGERAMIRLSGRSALSISESLLTVTEAPRPGRLGLGWMEIAPAPEQLADRGPGAVPEARGSDSEIARTGHREIDLDGRDSDSETPGTGRSDAHQAPPSMGSPIPIALMFFAGPRSLTGEDVVELHLPGWPALVTELLRRAVAAGARPAARGEFLRRGLIHGRIDLEGALAVGRLAASREADDARAAASCLSGQTARLGEALRDELLATLALLEAHVDFEEADTEAIAEPELRAGLVRSAALAQELVTGSRARPSADGETDVVLLGPPNAGKSSLFLALCPGAETTVSPQPGTTRDALSATVEHGGRRWRLIDGPGVGEVEDPLDALAAERFLAALPVAAVVLHVESVASSGEGRRAVDTEEHRQRRLSAVGSRELIAVASRCDLLAAGGQRPLGLCTSSLTGEGLDALWQALHAAAPVPRMADFAERAEVEAAAHILPLLQGAAEEDFWGALPVLSLQLREVLERLESEREQPLDVTAALLDRIFSGFCIGK